MPRTNVPPQMITAGGGYPTLPLGAGTADLTEQVADTVSLNDTALVDGKTLVLAHNTGATPHTVTVSSVADSLNRTGDITSYSVGAGKISRFGPFKTTGWANAGRLLFQADNAEVKFIVLTLP